MASVLVTHDGPVTIVTIDRPAVRNAIDAATANALREVWLAFDADDHARVGVFTGGDSVFCAGADLSAVTELAQNNNGEDGPLGCTRLMMSKPVIGAVAGYCVAGGLELACWCDLRIADESAVFGCFERRFGVPLVDGGTQRLPQIIGTGRALEMILTGRAVDVHEAHAWGLVNVVTPRGQHLSKAVELAHTLAQFPQAAMRNDRRALYEVLGKPLAEGLQIEARWGAETLHDSEWRSGAQAFVQGKGRAGKND